jgi:micrococcal nuclease
VIIPFRQRRSSLRPIVLTLVLLALAGWELSDWFDFRAFLPEPSTPSGVRGTAFHIIDGDTVSLNGERIRIVNIDTPESGQRAGCASERRLAQQATWKARTHFRNASHVQVRRTGTDRYGRTLARIRLDGRDFGRTMIREGVAQPWRGRQHEWCA